MTYNTVINSKSSNKSNLCGNTDPKPKFFCQAQCLFYWSFLCLNQWLGLIICRAIHSITFTKAVTRSSKLCGHFGVGGKESVGRTSEFARVWTSLPSPSPHSRHFVVRPSVLLKRLTAAKSGSFFPSDWLPKERWRVRNWTGVAPTHNYHNLLRSEKSMSKCRGGISRI